MKVVTKTNDKEKNGTHVQFSLTKSSEDCQTLQNFDEKQYFQYWILCLVVFNWKSRKQRLLVEALYQGLQTFLSDGHINYYTTFGGPGILRNVIVSGYVTFCQIKRFFVNILCFHY